MKTLVLFHRDLRLDDNTALIQALQNSDAVVPCVVAEGRLGIHSDDGGIHAARFILESLEDLDQQLRERGGTLYVCTGKTEEVVSRLVRDAGVDAVYFNRDYSPVSREWEARVTSAAEECGVVTEAWDDRLLHAPGVILKDDGTPYTVFTPYHRRASHHPVREPRLLEEGRWATVDSDTTIDALGRQWKVSGEGVVKGGRAAAMKILAGLEHLGDYNHRRDVPAQDGTTSLSPYLRSGCVSAREVLRAIRDRLGDKHELIRQLHWRDFFTQIAFHFPHVFTGAFHRYYDALEWDDDEGHFDAWKQGRTGVPMVDAGMRELAATGQMHNRVRMVVASFLVKDLHIDWRRGERHFAETLVDYDPAVNNGNWQWAASTGCDAQPYFRIFNPWLQQKKFDPDAVYVKAWVPELAGLSAHDIHSLWKDKGKTLVDYPRPIVDHTEESRIAKGRFQRVRQARD